MVQAPDPKAQVPPRTQPDRSAPIIQVTAGGPDYKRLLEALRWLYQVSQEKQRNNTTGCP